MFLRKLISITAIGTQAVFAAPPSSNMVPAVNGPRVAINATAPLQSLVTLATVKNPDANANNTLTPVTPATQSSMSGFFFSPAAAREVLVFAQGLSSSVGPAQMNDPMLAGAKALSLVMLNGPMSGAKLTSQLTQGSGKGIALNFNPKETFTAEALLGITLTAYNNAVAQAVNAGQEDVLNSPNVKAFHSWLSKARNGYLAAQGRGRDGR